MEISGSYEYIVKRKPDARLRLYRVALILGYILYVVVFLAVIMGGGAGVGLAPLFALVPITLWMIIFFTWRYVSIEYEYTIAAGVMRFDRIFGSRSRKKIIEITVRQAALIAPMTEEYSPRVDEFAPERVINCLSSDDAPDAYFILFESGEDKKRTALLFEATSETLKFLRYYNPSSTVVKKVKF